MVPATARSSSISSAPTSSSKCGSDGIKKKFGCKFSGCEKSYSRSDSLKRHAWNHMDGETCSRCSAQFWRRDLLDRHMARHREKDDEAGGEGLGVLDTRKRRRPTEYGAKRRQISRPERRISKTSSTTNMPSYDFNIQPQHISSRQEPNELDRPSISTTIPLLEYPAKLSPTSPSELLYRDLPSLQKAPEMHEMIQLEKEASEEKKEFKNPCPPKAPSTTGAARLLLVRPIAEILSAEFSNENYPILQEQRRGLLKLSGRSNTPPGNLPPDITRGMLDFSRETVCDLANSYNNNMNNMHPILAPAQLDALVAQFLKSVPGSQASRALEEYSEFSQRVKRKSGHPFQSIHCAVVLLVMALGEICQHKGKIPEVVIEKNNRSFGDSATIRNGNPLSPLQNSSSLSIPTGTAISPNAWSTVENLNAVPGLAYFALATDILGNQLAGNTLLHVYPNILAGLYHGQLGRVLESHNHIAAACRILHIILSPQLDRLREIKARANVVASEDNSLLFAFWTCLQLESDIIAELPCPPSKILTYQEDIPIPNLTAACAAGIDRKTLESYTAQIYLRKHLNTVYNTFYKPYGDNQRFLQEAIKGLKHVTDIEAHQATLGIDQYAPTMRWDVDKGEPADDILGARLRAKYYGAQVLTYRVFVLGIFEYSSRVGEKTSNVFLSNIDTPMASNCVTRIKDLPHKVLEYAKKGIEALIYSTKAFHRLGDPGRDRLIVTNVWGTAHAQWGNMLTLLTAYMNSILCPLVLELVTKKELCSLLQKTVAFLLLHGTRTSALHIDYQILNHVGQKAGLLLRQGNIS